LRNDRATTALWVALVGTLSGVAVAAPTYYTDGSVDYGDGSYQAAYTASYNYSPNFYTDAGTASASTTGRSSKSRSARVTQQQPQANYYTNVAYSSIPQQDMNSAADMYGEQQQPEQTASYHWDSSYASQQQAPKKRSLVKRMFSRTPETSQQTYTSSGNVFQRGVASWYGRDWHGRKTANGERYNMDSMTAAHKTLPFGTMVKVKNETNGRECVVRINNRGPFTKGRVIDLSRAAASQLGMMGRGVCKVSMEVMGR